ncbi:MAG: hypothetical protein RIQ79_229 [Verrucomicrobiota bacterium]
MRKPTTFPIVAALAAALVLVGGLLALRLAPGLVNDVFAQGAGRLAGVFLGVPGVRMEAGWALPFAAQPVLVTAACAATDFYVMAAALLGWHFMRRAGRPVWLPVVVAGALLAAVPVTLLVNALRIVAVAHAHHWVISRLPVSYDAFLHMLTGAAVFLPALIGLNLLLEYNGRISLPSSRS